MTSPAPSDKTAQEQETGLEDTGHLSGDAKPSRSRGLAFWLILVALGSALCLVSIELVRGRLPAPQQCVELFNCFPDGNIDSAARYHKGPKCADLYMDIFVVYPSLNGGVATQRRDIRDFWEKTCHADGPRDVCFGECTLRNRSEYVVVNCCSQYVPIYYQEIEPRR